MLSRGGVPPSIKVWMQLCPFCPFLRRSKVWQVLSLLSGSPVILRPPAPSQVVIVCVMFPEHSLFISLNFQIGSLNLYIPASRSNIPGNLSMDNQSRVLFSRVCLSRGNVKKKISRTNSLRLGKGPPWQRPSHTAAPVAPFSVCMSNKHWPCLCPPRPLLTTSK